MKKRPNYLLPAEWEPHKSTFICWPIQIEDWPGKYAPIPWVYVEIVKRLVNHEVVKIIVQSDEEIEKVKKILQRAHVELYNVEFIVAETDRGWMRDSSPAFVKKDNETVAVKFNFNAWAKYDNYKKDRKIPQILASASGIDLVAAVHKDKKVVLEGGAIDVNGIGSLLTTEECLLHPEIQVRNPGFNKEDYEKVFKKYFGVTNTIWLGRGINGDDTHGHVDDLCRFVNPTTAVLCMESNSSDDNYMILEENYERLQDARLEDGSKLNVIELPMPEPLSFEDMRLPASYANFYIANSIVLVPTFNDPNDRTALGILSECFPDREVIGIHSVDLVWGLGTIHCLTHEEPS